MSKWNEYYIHLIKVWLHSVQKYNVQPITFYDQFRKLLFEKVKIEVQYDSQIVQPIIIHLQSYTEFGLPKKDSNSQQNFQNLIAIIKVLYGNMFISKKDVADIMQKVRLTQQHILLFISSKVQPNEARWNSCIPYSVQAFWFIASFKKIDFRLQIQLYESLIDSHFWKDKQSIAKYYQILKEKLKKQELEAKCSSSYASSLQKTSDSSTTNDNERGNLFDLDVSSIEDNLTLTQIKSETSYLL